MEIWQVHTVEAPMTQLAPELVPRLKGALKRRGFYDPGVLQLYKRGQAFGLVRRVDKILEMHIRGFKDGLIEAEIEISRDYFEHLGPNSCRSAQSELESILKEEGISFTSSSSSGETDRVEIPSKLTEWRKVLGLTALGIFAGIPAAILTSALINPKAKSGVQK
ncbi:MAG: hypothetical protein ACFE9D_09125 [Promethearchaeota archaeon]